MSKITLNSVGSLIDVTTAQTTINDNFNTIEDAFDNTLSRDGTSPNTMGSTLDMNGNAILNLPAPVSLQSPLRLTDANTLNGGGTISGIPVGGTTGQILTKNSNTDYDAGWATQSVAVGNVTGTGTGITTFLTTPSSANLRAALTDEVGTGAAYFVGGALGTPASATLTNATGLPISTGVSGLGTGVATALGVAVGSAGAPVTFNGAGGTPSSMTGTNITNLNATNLASGTVPTARMPDYGAPTSTTAVTVASSSGTITSANATLRYQIRGKQVWFTITVNIVNNGTGAGNVVVSGLPWTFNSDAILPGRATAGTGKLLQAYCTAAGSAFSIYNYDNTYPGSTGEVLKVTGTAETT